MKIRIDLESLASRTEFRPGLNWNEKTDAVFEALDTFKQALDECQAVTHDPNYEEGPGS